MPENADHTENAVLLAEMAHDCGIGHVVDSAILDGIYYILGFRGTEWALAYGAEDGEWGFCFSLYSEVGEPYQPWFLKAVPAFFRDQANLADESSVRFEFDETHRGGTYKGGNRQPYDIPGSLVLALGPERAFEQWTGLPAVHIIGWDEAAIPQDALAVIPFDAVPNRR